MATRVTARAAARDAPRSAINRRAAGGPERDRRYGRGQSARVAPTLKLHEPPAEAAGEATRGDQPVDGTSDPRWVLAVRAGEQLQGAVLPPEARERLLRLGRLLGLTTFDSNLVIAIVQDQARRGVPSDWCARAGVGQLGMVPSPEGRRRAGIEGRSRAATIGWLAAGLIGLEVALLAWLL